MPLFSELRKIKSNKAKASVVSWAKKQTTTSLFISSITILEIELGIRQKEHHDPHQAAALRAWLESQVINSFSDRTLNFDTKAARRCAKLHVPDPKPERDAMIAATALVHDLTLVTRNTKDFQHIDIYMVNPWLEQ